MNTDPTLLKQCAEKGAEAAFKTPLPNGHTSSLLYVDPSCSFGFPDDEPARITFAQAAIEHYLAANPMWVSADKRKPTADDSDDGGDLPVFGPHGFAYEYYAHVEDGYLWTSVKNIPKLAPKYDAEFESWYAGKSGDKDLLYSAWKAGRSQS